MRMKSTGCFSRPVWPQNAGPTLVSLSSDRHRLLPLPDKRRTMQRGQSVGRSVGPAFIGQVVRGGRKGGRKNENTLYNPGTTAGKRNPEWHHWSSTRKMATDNTLPTARSERIVYQQFL
jgi:hypothetical protein